MEYNIEDWVEDGPEDRKEFRQAVHTILFAIAESEYLQPKMVIKGGMLLGIRYKSDRFTEDIDFSTSEKYSEINDEEFEQELNEALLIAFDGLNYGIKCLVQSLKVQPKKHIESATFPSLKLKIGYAHVSSTKSISRLENTDWWEFIDKAKSQGKIRYSGVSGHGSNLADCLEYCIDRNLVDVILSAFSFAQDPKFFEKLRHTFHFVAINPRLPEVLLKAKNKGIGIIKNIIDVYIIYF